MVDRPATAGAGQLAILRASGSYVNVRTGPGTQFDDIGDIISGTQVMYYPSTRTADSWVWVEQYGSGGWVFGEVMTLTDIALTPPKDYPPTPYDGKVAVWHWKGEAVPEDTIEEFIANLRRNAPAVSQVWVKIGDGNAWQGNFDDSAMAINGPADIDEWVRVLGVNGLEFHAWIVLKGVDIEGEAALMIEACKRPGVKSLILDVEPYEGYWEVGPEPIRPLMINVRRALGGRYHIGMSMDPRPRHYESIYPREWLPFVNSVHPQTYWRTFGRPVGEVVEEVANVWGNYGRPIIPAFQGDASLSDQLEGQAIAANRYGWKGVSWWRYGTIGQWSSINQPITVTDDGSTETVEDAPPAGTAFGDEQIIFPGEAGFRSGTYTGREEFQRFQGAYGWDAYYVSSEVSTSKVWAEWTTQLNTSGNYQISVFIPTRHSTTRKARYKIHAVRGTNTEIVVDLNQSIYRNQWVPLGVFDLVKEAPNAGKVLLNDVTGEPDKQVAFDAVRLRQIIVLSQGMGGTGGGEEQVNGVYIADGYDPPVGTESERRSRKIWPDGWRDASPYAELYFVGTVREAYHTGADLNYGTPYQDLGAPVYSPASGIVIYQADLRPWGNLTIIRHDPLRSATGPVLYTRYGHMQNVPVKVGQRVKRGDKIGEIGTGGGRFVPHLHFDVVHTNILETKPGDWPGRDLQRLLRHYSDPQKFIANNRP